MLPLYLYTLNSLLLYLYTLNSLPLYFDYVFEFIPLVCKLSLLFSISTACDDVICCGSFESRVCLMSVPREMVLSGAQRTLDGLSGYSLA